MIYAKCHSDESIRNYWVKRGKLQKQETQIMVGESINSKDAIELSIYLLGR